MVDVDRERELLRNRVLGRALRCDLIDPGADLARDLQLTNNGSGLDLACVQGVDCLGQSLAVALTTLLGSDLFNTEFGFDGLRALAEETNPVLVRERVRIAIIQVLRKEPRVRGIIDVKLDDGQLDPPAAGSRTLHVRVTFQVVSGDQLTLDLGRMVPYA